MPDDTPVPIDLWNETLAPQFIAWRHLLVGAFAAHSDRIFPALPLRQGNRVLDIGCGFGDAAIELAQRVGPSGSVTGLDFCRPFLDIAARDAKAAGVGNVSFIEGDAQGFAFRPEYDLCFSRFGMLSFADPVAGLANVRRALKPGGRLVTTAWRPIADNPWFGTARQIVLRYLPEPDIGNPADQPGPFSMADSEIARQRFEAAGYSEIDFERVDAPIRVGRDLAEALDFQLSVGPASSLLRAAGDEGARHRSEITAALKDTLAPHAMVDGVALASSSWKISARNPG